MSSETKEQDLRSRSPQSEVPNRPDRPLAVDPSGTPRAERSAKKAHSDESVPDLKEQKKFLPNNPEEKLDINEIPVSTKTFIVMTNVNLNLLELFRTLNVVEYVPFPKTRGKKKENTKKNLDLPDGSIITLEIGNLFRGVLLKKKKKKKSETGEELDLQTKPFRNSLTVVMVIDGKKINFKVYRNGKFQLTGCKTDKHAMECIKHMWKYVGKTDIFQYQNKKTFEAIFVPAMRNIDFKLGFMVNRENLDKYINTETNYTSLLETSIGYTGVNIKIPVRSSILDLKIKKLRWSNRHESWRKIVKVPYQEFLDKLTPKERKKKLEKRVLVTFLVFNSGSTIVSAMCKEVMKDVFYEFCRIIQQNRVLFEEKIG